MLSRRQTPMEVTIKDRVISHESPTFIIAEIGGNFLTFNEGKALIDKACEIGVDAVKIQTFRADTVTSKKAMYDMENTGKANQYELFKKFELSNEVHTQVFDYAKDKNILLFSTPGHQTDVDYLERYDMPCYKIGSDDVCNLPLIKYIAELGKPILLATGMCTMEEVRESVGAILGTGNNQLILLHCVTNYPTYPESVNLKAIETMRNEFGLPVGYSDHTIGIYIPIAAAAMGACVIEKHFTLDKNAEGPDHMLSADPFEMKQIVDGIRIIEKARGDGVKRPAKSEMVTRKNNRKSIVAVKNISRGTMISRDMIDIKRPGYGIPPKYIELIVGRTAKKDIEAEDAITWEMI